MTIQGRNKGRAVGRNNGRAFANHEAVRPPLNAFNSRVSKLSSGVGPCILQFSLMMRDGLTLPACPFSSLLPRMSHGPPLLSLIWPPDSYEKCPQVLPRDLLLTERPVVMVERAGEVLVGLLDDSLSLSLLCTSDY